MAKEKQTIEASPSEVQVIQPAIVMPVVAAEEALKAWQAYLDLKLAIAVPEDIQLIKGKQFLKKSYWRKVATFFNLNVEIVEERKETLVDADGNPVDAVYHFTCKATAPNGRYTTGTGSFQVSKKDGDHHNARSHAETRAFNRAVSNLVGGGEVSADEIDAKEYDPERDV